MALWKRAISFIVPLPPLLAGCAQVGVAPPRLDVAGAHLASGSDGDRLTLDCRWKPSDAMLEALDHGIVLALRLKLVAQAPPQLGWHRDLASAVRHVELRYFPLTRQYQLRDVEGGRVRSYAVRATALASLEKLELVLPELKPAAAVERYRVDVAFDTDALPGALRLPALVQPRWRQADASYTWSARAD